MRTDRQQILVDESFVALYSDLEAIPSVSQAGDIQVRGWILDSGCTAHLCGDQSKFEQLNASSQSQIKLVNKETSEIKGEGTVRLSVMNNQERKLVEFNNVLFVPDLRVNLVSVARVIDRGFTVTFRRDSAEVVDGRVRLAAKRRDLYYIQEERERVAIAEAHDDD